MYPNLTAEIEEAVTSGDSERVEELLALTRNEDMSELILLLFSMMANLYKEKMA